MSYRTMVLAKFALNHISEINKDYVSQTVYAYNLSLILQNAKNAKIIII